MSATAATAAKLMLRTLTCSTRGPVSPKPRILLSRTGTLPASHSLMVY